MTKSTAVWFVCKVYRVKAFITGRLLLSASRIMSLQYCYTFDFDLYGPKYVSGPSNGH